MSITLRAEFFSIMSDYDSNTQAIALEVSVAPAA
jgi:hypothetical protein